MAAQPPSAAELLAQLLRDQAARLRVAQDQFDREHQALVGLARNATTHGLSVAQTAREAGVSRQTAHKWLSQSADTVPGPSRADGNDSAGSGRGLGRPGPQDRGKGGDVLSPEPSASAPGLRNSNRTTTFQVQR